MGLCAQELAAPGPYFTDPHVRRLPSPDLVAAPAEEFMPQVEVPEDLESSEDLELEEEADESDSVFSCWEGSFELGLDGTSGNTQAFNLRFGVDAKRETDLNRITLDLDYRKNTTNDIETANRSLFDWRYEYLFPESRWTAFLHGTLEYDEFQVFDLRVTSDLGLGYRLIETEQTKFSARFGSGFSHEIGGPDDSYVPEAVFGLDFERQLNKRQKITLSSEYTPDMTGFGDFRLQSRASWEALIDEQMNLNLKLSVLDRYDSTPNGAKPNDLDYSAVLLWKF
jgi:putative salt-induced outer membrane protein YdiY